MLTRAARFSLTQGYGYHPNGQKASWTAPDGTVIGFAYTGHGELREVTVPGQGAITMGDFRWTRPETVTYPGGAVRTERYDALQRTRQITVRAGAETRMDWRYTYDPVGNISRIDTEHGRYGFGYDALDRLTEADYPNGPQHDQINASFASDTFPFADDRYSYDPIGRAGAFAPHAARRRADGQGWPARRAKHGQRSNRLSSQSQPGPWAYNGNSEKIQSPFGIRSYNAAGSTVEERTPTDQLIRRFAYDTEERPVEVSDAQGLRIARYYHDPFGRRLWKTLEPGAEGHSGRPGPETVYLAYSDEGYAAEFRLPGTPETAPTTGPASFTTIWVHRTLLLAEFDRLDDLFYIERRALSAKSDEEFTRAAAAVRGFCRIEARNSYSGFERSDNPSRARIAKDLSKTKPWPESATCFTRAEVVEAWLGRGPEIEDFIVPRD